MNNFDEMRNAYERALGVDTTYILKENEKLKNELHVLQQRYERVLTALQDSVESVLRVAREGKTDS